LLFNSYEFIFVFLPVTLGGYLLLSRYATTRAVTGWVFAVSLAFYAYWSLPYLGLLLLSIVVNFWVSQRLVGGHDARRRRFLVAGIVFNLSLLAGFKYAGFVAANVSAIAGAPLGLHDVVVPIGISFYTFTQVAYLVDCHRDRRCETTFAAYGLFVTIFPHLIMGPIIHHREMLPQFRHMHRLERWWSDFAGGIAFFCIGLFKKVMLADSVAVYATPIFVAADAGLPVSTFEAWGGALAYTLQIYFDFSGYCDMAIGLGLMIGVRLPINFASPYQAASIIDFWRRWHVTLSRFLRSYLYIPLGGNRHGPVRTQANILATMLLGGLWHGASWTFVAWGGLHGSYLILAHVLGRPWTRALGRVLSPAWTRRANIALTMLAVIVGWVIFRAGTFEGARTLIAAMLCLDGCSLPSALAAAPLRGALTTLGIRIDADTILLMKTWARGWPLLVILFVATQNLPSSQALLSYRGPDAGDPRPPLPLAAPPRLRWQPDRRWAVALAVAAAVCLLNLSSITEFLYFQF
jgi:D-alanyl-lipoteichoic acid acyltransferase DltB (MBOAT superfamily)